MATTTILNTFRPDAPMPLDARDQVANIAARDAMPSSVLWEGMTVYIVGSKEYYRLTSVTPVTWELVLDGISQDTLDEVAANSLKVGVTQGNLDDIEANNLKVGILPSQANTIQSNRTAVVGILATNNQQQTEIDLNTAKETFPGFGPTGDLALRGNTVTISTQQRDDINANNNKEGFPGFGTDAGTVLRGDTVIPQSYTTDNANGFIQDSDITTTSSSITIGSKTFNPTVAITGFTEGDGIDITGTSIAVDFGTGANQVLRGNTQTISSSQAAAIVANTNKPGFPGFGTTNTTVLRGDTAIITATERARIAANFLKVGVTPQNLLDITANNDKTSFPGFGLTATTALPGNTRTITVAEQNAIGANTTGRQTNAAGLTAVNALYATLNTQVQTNVSGIDENSDRSIQNQADIAINKDGLTNTVTATGANASAIGILESRLDNLTMSDVMFDDVREVSATSVTDATGLTAFVTAWNAAGTATEGITIEVGQMLAQPDFIKISRGLNFATYVYQGDSATSTAADASTGKISEDDIVLIGTGTGPVTPPAPVYSLSYNSITQLGNTALTNVTSTPTTGSGFTTTAYTLSNATSNGISATIDGTTGVVTVSASADTYATGTFTIGSTYRATGSTEDQTGSATLTVTLQTAYFVAAQATNPTAFVAPPSTAAGHISGDASVTIPSTGSNEYGLLWLNTMEEYTTAPTFTQSIFELVPDSFVMGRYTMYVFRNDANTNITITA